MQSNVSPLRGVNLGGWLVVEKWMTPSLFAKTSAVTNTSWRVPLAAQRSYRRITSRLLSGDFVWLKNHDINAVRVPIGFWALTDEPPLENVQKQLDIAGHLRKVAKMATKIAVWQRKQPVIIGEWSLGLDDASLQGMPRAEAEKQFGAAQLQAYAVTAGWFFWNYKTERTGGWNYRYLVDQGVLSEARP